MSNNILLAAKNHHAYCYMQRFLHQPRVLIISSDHNEIGVLHSLFSANNYLVDTSTNNIDVIQAMQSKKRYEIIIVSDRFVEVDLKFIKSYFYSKMRKRKSRLIHLVENDFGVKVIGFDVHLSKPIF